MVLLKIESLSTAELQYIASQERMEDWESLSREELIDALSELYEDSINEAKESKDQRGLHKFCNCLSDVQYTKLMNLPGVEALPDEYLETSIHIIMKDPFWAYVFWSVSPNTIAECEDIDPDYRVFLRSFAYERNETYDINIGADDFSWTISLPWMGTRYQIHLMVEYPKLKTFEVLAVSEEIKTPAEFDSKVIESLKGSQQASLIFSSIVSKNGEVIDNKVVNDLFTQLNEGSRDE